MPIDAAETIWAITTIDEPTAAVWKTAATASVGRAGALLTSTVDATSAITALTLDGRPTERDFPTKVGWRASWNRRNAQAVLAVFVFAAAAIQGTAAAVANSTALARRALTRGAADVVEAHALVASAVDLTPGPVVESSAEESARQLVASERLNAAAFVVDACSATDLTSGTATAVERPPTAAARAALETKFLAAFLYAHPRRALERLVRAAALALRALAAVC